MTRNGKIARLPQAVRNTLNQRLGDGEQGKQLVAWLNDLPEVRQVMEAQFQGKPVTEQNLSEWKQGGYLDWLRHQEALVFARTAKEQAQELAEETGSAPMTDVLSASVALLLAKMIRQLEQTPDATPETRQEVLALIREWTAVRKGDHYAARLKMRQADWDKEQAKIAEEEGKAAEALNKAVLEENSLEGRIAAFDKKYRRIEREVIRETQEILRHRMAINRLCKALPEAKRDELRDHIDSDIKSRQSRLLEEFTVDLLRDGLISEAEADAAGFDDDPSESESIRPDPTKKSTDQSEEEPEDDVDLRPKSGTVGESAADPSQKPNEISHRQQRRKIPCTPQQEAVA